MVQAVDVLDPLERELLLASRMRLLFHEHRMLAHDIRAPLNAINLSLELLTVTLGEDPGADQEPRWQRHIAVVREELGRLHQSVDARLEHERDPLGEHRERFDLGSMVAELVELLSSEARGRRIPLEARAGERPAWLYGTRARLKQAVFNLLLHELDAIGRREPLVISVQQEQRAAGGVISLSYAAACRLRWPQRVSESGGEASLYIAYRLIQLQGGELVQQRNAEGEDSVRLLFSANDLPG